MSKYRTTMRFYCLWRRCEKLAVSAKAREAKEENQLEKYIFETYALLSGEKMLGKRLEIIERSVI